MAAQDDVLLVTFPDRVLRPLRRRASAGGWRYNSAPFWHTALLPVARHLNSWPQALLQTTASDAVQRRTAEAVLSAGGSQKQAETGLAVLASLRAHLRTDVQTWVAHRQSAGIWPPGTEPTMAQLLEAAGPTLDAAYWNLVRADRRQKNAVQSGAAAATMNVQHGQQHGQHDALPLLQLADAGAAESDRVSDEPEDAPMPDAVVPRDAPRRSARIANIEQPAGQPATAAEGAAATASPSTDAPPVEWPRRLRDRSAPTSPDDVSRPEAAPLAIYRVPPDALDARGRGRAHGRAVWLTLTPARNTPPGMVEVMLRFGHGDMERMLWPRNWGAFVSANATWASDVPMSARDGSLEMARWSSAAWEAARLAALAPPTPQPTPLPPSPPPRRRLHAIRPPRSPRVQGPLPEGVPWVGWALLPSGPSNINGLPSTVRGIPLPRRKTERSFSEYLRADDRRWRSFKTREQSKEWSLWLWRIPVRSAVPICFAFGRAQSIVKTWTKQKYPGAPEAKIRELCRSERLSPEAHKRIVYTKIAPTLMANPWQHLFVFGAPFNGIKLNRSFGVGETADLMGLPREDRMYQLLHELRTPAQALSDLGESMSGQLLALMFEQWALGEAGLLAGEITYGSHFSCLDMPGMTLRNLARRGVLASFRQRFAAERRDPEHPDGVARHAMLTVALEDEGATVYDDAMSKEATVDAPPVDVFTSTFECDPNSSANRGASEGDLDANLNQVSRSMAYVRARAAEGKEPALIILENTEGLLIHHRDQFDSVLNIILRLPYRWHIDVLCPSLHADVPNARRRVYFVGFAKRRRGPLQATEMV